VKRWRIIKAARFFETNNAVKQMAQKNCHLMSPEENFNPEKEPEPYDLWFLSSTRDQTQDAAAKFFLF